MALGEQLNDVNSISEAIEYFYSKQNISRFSSKHNMHVRTFWKVTIFFSRLTVPKLDIQFCHPIFSAICNTWFNVCIYCETKFLINCHRVLHHAALCIAQVNSQIYNLCVSFLDALICLHTVNVWNMSRMTILQYRSDWG